MQIGIQLPEVERVVPWPEYRTMALVAEAVGFDSLWVGDHLLYDKPDGALGPWECWSVLAAVAAITDNVLLGPLVSPTGFRNPALTAKMAGTVDEISGGRLILGLGSGWNRREYEAYGFPYDYRVSRFEEEFAIIVGLIRQGEIDFRGKYHAAERVQLIPPARPDLPIMIGSQGDRMLEITAPHMNWWNEWWNRFSNHPDGLRPIVNKVDAALEAAGRNPSDVVKTVALHVRLGGGEGRQMGHHTTAPPIEGSSDAIAAQILAFSDLVSHVQLVVDPITIESVEWLGSVVAQVQAG